MNVKRFHGGTVRYNHNSGLRVQKNGLMILEITRRFYVKMSKPVKEYEKELKFCFWPLHTNYACALTGPKGLSSEST